MSGDTSFLEYLPGIPNNFYEHKEIPAPTTVVKAYDKHYNVLPEQVLKGRGMLTTGTLTTDNPKLGLTVVFDGKNYSIDIEQLNKIGYTSYVTKLPYINAYNLNGLYTVTWIANRGFNRDVQAYLFNASSTDATLVDLLVDIYRFNPGFYSAMARLKMGEELIPSYVDEDVQVKP